MVKAVAFKRGAFGLLCLATSAISAAWAAPTPQGAPFRLSSCTTCRQQLPAVAGHTTGAFLSVWEGLNAASTQSVNGRSFAATGAAQGSDFSILQAVAPDQYDAAVARDNQGSYIVVWSSVANGNSEIMARKYRPNGTPVAPAFKVNVDPAGTPTIPSDFNPAVARTKDGGFIVVWMNLLPSSATFDGTPPQVLARRFNAAGAPLGGQVKVSTGLVNGDRPDVCVDTAGQPVIVWTSVDAFRPFQTNYKGVSLRRLTAQGAPSGASATVVAPPTSLSVRPAVSCGAGGTFVVAWHSDEAPAVERTDILGQRFTRLGRPIGAKLLVNTTTTKDQKNPSISHDPSGAFVVVWQADLGSRIGIYGRRFTAAGGATGPDFEVASDNENSRQPSNPDVSHLGGNNFVVVWQAGLQGVFGRRFTP